MANTATKSAVSGQMPNDAQFRVRLRLSIDTYTTGGVVLDTLINDALSSEKLTASKVTDGFANVVNNAEGLKHVAELDAATRKLTLKKQGGSSDLVEASAGAITAVAVDVTLFFN